MRRFTMCLALAALVVAVPAAAQDEADHGMATADGVPEGWLMRFDRATATPDMADFQVMEPGWHVKTGRAGAAIFWQPASAVEGAGEVGATYHLFNPASHAEAFGLFLGGHDLAGPDQRYVYFLVRQTGEYLIKRRAGEETETLVGWTAHEAVPEAPAGEAGPTEYVLDVVVGSETVEFQVNGQTVHSMPRGELDIDGVAGLRINHMLDVHVEELTVAGM